MAVLMNHVMANTSANRKLACAAAVLVFARGTLVGAVAAARGPLLPALDGSSPLAAMYVSDGSASVLLPLAAGGWGREAFKGTPTNRCSAAHVRQAVRHPNSSSSQAES